MSEMKTWPENPVIGSADAAKCCTAKAFVLNQGAEVYVVAAQSDEALKRIWDQVCGYYGMQAQRLELDECQDIVIFGKDSVTFSGE